MAGIEASIRISRKATRESAWPIDPIGEACGRAALTINGSR